MSKKLLSINELINFWNFMHFFGHVHLLINTLRAAWFRRFSQKNSSFRLPYQRPSSSAHCARELFSGSNGSASLVDCTRKKFFAWGCGFFLSDVISGGLFGPLCLALGANH